MSRARLIAVRLAKEGFAGGDPEKVLRMKVTTVLDILAYSNFAIDYQAAASELNKPENK